MIRHVTVGVFSVLVLFVAITGGVQAGTTQPVSISIAYVTSDVEGAGQILKGDTKLLGATAQLVTELSQNYDCSVNLRVNGAYIAAEQAIESLKNIRTSASSAVRLAAADYVVGIYTRPATSGDAYINGTVLCVSTETSDISAIKKSKFSAKSVTDIPGQAAKAVAELLTLKKKQEPDAAFYGDASKHVWAILPFASPDKGQLEAVSGDLILEIELALQDKIGTGKLVERQALEKIMKEHNLGAMHSSADIQYLAKMVNADRFITGQVATWDKGLRVDVQVVAADTATIVGSKAISNVSKQDLHSKITECILSAVRAAGGASAMPMASLEKRRREAEWFKNEDFYIKDPKQTVFVRNALYLDYISSVDRLEGAYLLVHDDPAFAYRVITDLAIRLDKAAISLSFAYKGLNATSRAFALINFAMDGLSSNPETPSPLLLKASALVSMQEYDKAMKLVEKHIVEHSGIDTCDALILKGRCLEKHDEAVWLKGGVSASMATLKQVLAIYEEAQKTGKESRLSRRRLGTWINDLDLAIKRVESSTGLEEAKKLGEEKEYAFYKRIFSPEATHQSFKYKDWKRFIELLEKFEKPEYIVQLKAHELQGLSDDVICSLPIYLPTETPPFQSVLNLWLLQGKSLRAMGKHAEAVRRLRDIECIGKMSEVSHLPIFQSAQKLADSIEAESGPVEDLWRTGAQTITNPPPYVIYFIPASFDKRYLPYISNKLNEFFGLKVKILPDYQIQPQDRVQEGTGNRLGKNFLRNVIVKTLIPDDALYVMVITGEPMSEGAPYTARADLLGSSTSEGVSDNPVIILANFNESKPNRNEKQISEAVGGIAHFIIGGFQCLYDWSREPAHGSEYAARGWHSRAKRCYNTPCLFSSEYTNFKCFRMKMCTECQETYRKKVNYEAIHKELMQTLKKMGATIVKPDEVRNTTVEANGK